MSDKPDTTPFSCMTTEQKIEAEKVVSRMVRECLTTIVNEGPRITSMDNRPRQTWSPEQPEVFFWYVKQNLLEELVARLSEQI